MTNMKWDDKPKYRPIKPEETRAGVRIGYRRTRLPFILIFLLVSMVWAVLVALEQLGISAPSIVLLIGAWSAINASETDADSPLNQTLFDKIRGNLDFLFSTSAQIANYTGSESQAESTANHYVVNDTIDFRNRNIHVVGMVVAASHGTSATALSYVDKLLPNGSEDDEIFFDVAGNGTDGIPVPGAAANQDEYDFVNGFMYAGAGGATYNTKPYLTYSGAKAAVAIIDFYIWVDSGNSGRLMLTVFSDAVTLAFVAAAWNLQITRSEDLS